MCLGRELAFILGVPILIINELFRYVQAKKNKKRFVNLKEIAIVIFSIYIMALIAVTLLPFYGFRAVKLHANLVPVFNTVQGILVTTSNMKGYMLKFWIINILGNIALLMPVSVFVPIIFQKLRNIKSVVTICASVSISIELLQYLSMLFGNFRSADIDDVILNVIGSIIGFYIFQWVALRNPINAVSK